MEQFAKLPRWGQFVAILIFGGLICTAAWFYPLSDWKSTMEARIAQSAELDAQIRQGKEAQRRVDELNRQIDLIRRDLDVLKSIIPVDPETGKLLRVFQTYARDQNLNIAAISPSAIAPKELYSEQAYKMTVGGGYHDVALFFDKIAHMRRIVNVTGLDMSSSTKKGQTVTANFNAMVYMQNPAAFQALEKKS
jgi:type IV pilus assembly protein PilO